MKKPVVLIPFVLGSLLLGLYTGLLRMGWQFPVAPGLGDHGALMVCTFLGTLVTIERIITLKYKWVIIIPVTNVLSLILFLVDLHNIAYWFLVIGSLGMSGVMFYYALRFKEIHFYIMLIGALCLFIGNLLLAVLKLYPASTTWWISFFMLTIVAERLELTRYLPVTKNLKYLLVVLMIVFLSGIILPFHIYGKYISSAALILIAFWLLTNDIAFKSIKKEGIFRYSAILLITSYFWLIITAAFFVLRSDNTLYYDAGLHAFFLGFVFSMIFAHAPIILPSIAKLTISPFSKLLYIWFALLQLSLIMRVAADVMGDYNHRKISGLISVIAILFFFLNLLMVVRKNNKLSHQL
jgi:hypothetical protein